MTTTGPQIPPPTPIVPPTAAIPTRPSAWPTVIGIIVTILGSLTALRGCFGLGSLLFPDQFMALMPQGEDAEMTSAMQRLKPAMIISGSLTMVLAIVLLIGGIGLLRHRAWGRRTCLTWAGLKLVLVVCTSVLAYIFQQAQFQAMAEDPNMAGNMPGFLPALMQAIGVLGLVFGLIWGVGAADLHAHLVLKTQNQGRDRTVGASGQGDRLIEGISGILVGWCPRRSRGRVLETEV